MGGEKTTSNTYKSTVKMDDYNVDRGRLVFTVVTLSSTETLRLQPWGLLEIVSDPGSWSLARGDRVTLSKTMAPKDSKIANPTRGDVTRLFRVKASFRASCS